MGNNKSVTYVVPASYLRTNYLGLRYKCWSSN